MAKQQVTLVTTVGHSVLPEALSLLEDMEVEVDYCPPSVAEWYECPFVRDSKGATYFGLEGIRFFVGRAGADRVA